MTKINYVPSQFLTLPIIRKIIVIILFLSLTDALFTDMGLRLGLIEEGNPIARMLYNLDVRVFYSFKLILPVVLLVLCKGIQPKKWLNISLYACFFLYAVVNIYHVLWISLATFV